MDKFFIEFDESFVDPGYRSSLTILYPSVRYLWRFADIMLWLSKLHQWKLLNEVILLIVDTYSFCTVRQSRYPTLLVALIKKIRGHNYTVVPRPELKEVSS